MRTRWQTSLFFIIFLLPPFSVEGGPKEDYRNALAAHKSGDHALAFQKFLALAEQGFAAAQSNVGVMYRIGRGVKRSYEEAAKWFRRAADKGVSSAQNNLGLLYAEGKGVPRDYVLAYMWLHLSYTQGSAKAGGSRDQISLEMTSEQIVEARKKAEVWRLMPRPLR
ncbi:MAG: tetratricopeptide repeat protein [bacterium]|nr:tetratricopeptide repeat protein [bacterium]